MQCASPTPGELTIVGQGRSAVDAVARTCTIRAMRRGWWLCAVVGLGCGPQVMLDDAGDADGGTTEGTDGGGVTSSSPPNPTLDPPTPDTGAGPADGADADEVTGDPPPPNTECWQVQELFEAPATAGIIISDQDGNGADELWLSFTEENAGPGPGQTTLFRVDDDGTPGVEQPLPGFLLALGDIEGDGLSDLVLVDFSMGFPPVFGWAMSPEPGVFTFPATPMELELQQGLSGFFDATADGPADVFAYDDQTGTLELRVGSGDGVFAVATGIVVGNYDNGFATRIAGASEHVLFASAQGFGGGGPGGPAQGCIGTAYHLLQTTGGELVDLAMGGAAGPTGLGPLLAARSYGDTIVAFTGYCDGDTDFAQLRRLWWTPDQMTLQSDTVLQQMQWASTGDFDGDGLLDIIFAEPGADQMLWSRGIDPITFDAPAVIDLELPEIRDNNVRPIDRDGDGRDELLRGSVLVDAEPPQLFYDRVWYGPC